MTAERPDWLTEPCPEWCDGEHDDQELDADRRHHSDYLVVPVIQHRERWHRRSHLNDDVEAGELSVLAVRDVGALETWIAIANDRQRIEVTLESARRLHAALGQLLQRVS